MATRRLGAVDLVLVHDSRAQRALQGLCCSLDHLLLGVMLAGSTQWVWRHLHLSYLVIPGFGLLGRYSRSSSSLG